MKIVVALFIILSMLSSTNRLRRCSTWSLGLVLSFVFTLVCCCTHRYQVFLFEACYNKGAHHFFAEVSSIWELKTSPRNRFWKNPKSKTSLIPDEKSHGP